MKVMLSGGGTAGSVTPLLAIAEQLKSHQIFFVGTYYGVERQLVPKAIPYLPLLAGKFRRYWSLRNLVDPFIIILACFQAWYMLIKYQPDVVVSAGGFVATPLCWAAWWCNIPVVLHQSDLRVSLSTKLVKPFATIITKAFSETPLQAEVIGNPVRDLTPTTHDFNFNNGKSIVLVMGGGTGAQAINTLVSKELCDLVNVIHLTGDHPVTIQHPNYHPFTLLKNNFVEAVHLANIVVCRAGLGTLSELATLGKPTLIIPIPHSHQVYNAEYFSKQFGMIQLDQRTLTAEQLVNHIQTVLHNPYQQLHQFPTDAAEQLCQRILQL